MITGEQAAATLKSMTNNRSPGSDGFGADFFKVFWKQLGEFVVRSINYGYKIGQLSITQRQGIITCIPKENKPRMFLKNYRPISLLNCVYKIASGAIARRLKDTLPKLIHEDQTGFMSGRNIGQNIRQLYDIMQYTEKHNITGLLLLVDFEKAFDSISWAFINKVFKFFGFGESIISWVNILYRNVNLAVNQGGNLSPFFTIGRGCRQGDPISGYIFLLCAEILAIRIRNNKSIRGIKIGDVEFRLSQFADDLSTVLDGSKTSLNETLEELNRFSKYSGLKVNFDKTYVIWIGNKKYSKDSIKTKWKLSWGINDFKLLGINFNVDLQKMTDSNFINAITKAKNLIQLWKRRYLTPLGRITVIKSLLLPIFTHLFLCLPNPSEEKIKELTNMCYDFLWNGPSKVKQSVVVKQYHEGGLKMINIRAFMNGLKISWLRKVILNGGKWKLIICQEMNMTKIINLGNEYIDKCQNSISNVFWKDVLKAVSTMLKLSKPNSLEDFLLTQIHENSLIKIGGKAIFLKNWYQKGIYYINDLLNKNAEFYTFQEFLKTFNIKTNFLQYTGIIGAIKTLAKKLQMNIHKKLPSPVQPQVVKILTKNSKGCGDFYNILNKNLEEPTFKSKWKEEYNIDDTLWCEIYQSSFKLKFSKSIQWFQYKINHRLLPTRKYLFNIKVTDNPLCKSCHEIETIEHLLWSCPTTQTFLRKMTVWINTKNEDFHLIDKEYIFNIGKEKSEADLHIISDVKYYIFNSKYNEKCLSTIACINKLKCSYKVLRELATEKNELSKFCNTWQKYRDLLNT